MEIVENRQSPALSSALQSESEFWHFVTDPATPYLDRWAAVTRGGNLIGVEQLPRLWKAVAEFQHLPFGVPSSPCDYLMSDNLDPWMWSRSKDQPVRSTVAKAQSRLILERSIEVPLNIDYPLSREEQDNAPWLWQMQRVLPILNSNVNKYYSQPDRYAAMAEAAWKWQPSDFWEASVREEALLNGPRNAAWIERLVRTALAENHPGIAAGATGPLYVWGPDSYHFEELIHAAQIAILQQTGKEDVAEQTAFWTARLAENKRTGPSQFKPMRTATAILAIAQWAQNQSLSDWSRYSFAAKVCQMLDEPPFKANVHLRPDAPEVTESLHKFEAWLVKERPGLEREAVKERQHLRDLAAEIHQTIAPVTDDLPPNRRD
ncbi:MAG TPA: hypothetical protein VMR62_30810 [Bryobacteraceae bacterium]|nr:hypothetical protein [Bryobacteraceae bacterium]